MSTSEPLSKSRVLAGLQCEKRLFLEIYRPELRDEAPDTDYTLAVGRQVGEFARSRYPNGILIEPASLDEAMEISPTLASNVAERHYWNAHKTVAKMT